MKALIVKLLLLFGRAQNNFEQLKIYHTNYPANIDGDHSCIYRYASTANGKGRYLIPYCIRTREVKYIDEPKICHGILYTFDELTRQKVSVDDLVLWNAPMDIVTDYAEWLPSKLNSQSVYCNCSSHRSSFGNRCQYQFVFEGFSLNHIVEQTFALKAAMNRDIRTLTPDNITCYIALQCKTIIPDFCLDWRQVCDGAVDCENGEDEENCQEMLLSECYSDTEYRCRSGHCIPYSFSFDLTLDCLDFYDEQEVFEKTMVCVISPSVDCEEHMCGLSRLSCGDGECFPGKHGLNGALCSGERVRLLIKKMFSFDAGENSSVSKKCYSTLLADFGLDLFFESIDSDSEEELTDVHYYDSNNPHPCTGTFLFPLNPIVFPFIRLGHKVHARGWHEWPLICINRSEVNQSDEELFFDMEGYACISSIKYSKRVRPVELKNLRDIVVLIQSIRVGFSHSYSTVTAPSLYRCTHGMHISRHNQFDGYYDCFTNDGDEDIITMSCYQDFENRYQCFRTGIVCIPRRGLNDGQLDCVDGDDELFGISCTEEYDCNHFRFKQLWPHSLFPVVYDEICNGEEIFDPRWLEIHGDLDTDETDCDYWPCNARSIRCNGKWDKKDGCDEIGCSNPFPIFYIRRISHCAPDEHYCAKFNKTTMGCLPVSKAADNVVDCLFSTDERGRLNKVRDSYLLPCSNVSSVYVAEDDLCNRDQLCPMGEDELLCPWHLASSCSDSEFTCKNGTCIPRRRRCDDRIDCQEGEDEWICDMFARRVPPELMTQRQAITSPLFASSVKLNISTVYAAFHCFRGILLREKDGYDACICPPSYYGKQCELQSHRITISFRVETLSPSNFHAIFQLVFCLLDSQHNHVLSHELLIVSPSVESIYKHLVYIMYPSFWPLSTNKSIHIDMYEMTNFGVNQRSLLSWYYDVQFPFLPVNRLAARLLIERKSANSTACSLLACQHGTCKSFVNSHRHFCQCDGGWTGLACNRSLDHLCKKLHCDPRSKCVALAGDDYALCLCPLGWTGINCRIPTHSCKNVHCKNGGGCISLDERARQYQCQCPTHYFGDLCQFSEAQLTMYMSSTTTYTRLMIIHFLHAPPSIAGSLLHRSIDFRHNIYPGTSITVRENSQKILSSFIIAQLIHDINEPYYGSYHLLAYSSNKNYTDLSTSINVANRCPHVHEYMNASMKHDNWLRRVKFYPKFLVNVTCYHDERFLCFIEDDAAGATWNCLIVNHQVASCIERNYCENGGRCFQKQISGQLDYTCICPECHYGEFCQLSMTQYSLTIDSILGQIIITNMPISKQPLVIQIILALVSILYLAVHWYPIHARQHVSGALSSINTRGCKHIVPL
ncbi:unnamed protein product [Adineta ricciae]|uniref:EGF-like domain-containing protein n=1 Tax=Adineta ricciae TaxID=249248 RepID=A0A815UQI3_ADIRI|nr:unnamed protein product [Adineta ricciae]CAF1528979.1 unnamed protein product [Adineta ricciae]